MEVFKKAALPVAGIALILYAFISILRGVSGFLPVLFAIGIVVLGITCLIEKTEPVRFGASAFLTVITLFGFFGSLFSFLRTFLRGYFTFPSFILSVVSILGMLLELIALAAVTALLFMFWKNMRNALTKLWYAPAALFFVSGVLSIISSLFMRMIYYRITFSLLLHSFLEMILTVFFTVGLAALALGSQKE